MDSIFQQINFPLKDGLLLIFYDIHYLTSFRRLSQDYSRFSWTSKVVHCAKLDIFMHFVFLLDLDFWKFMEFESTVLIIVQNLELFETESFCSKELLVSARKTSHVYLLSLPLFMQLQSCFVEAVLFESFRFFRKIDM